MTMLGLTAYSSSSEDEASAPPLQKRRTKVPNDSQLTVPTQTSQRPVVGPSRPTQTSSQSGEEGYETGSLASREETPSTDSRTLVRDLTLPPIPNLDIPPSPPGSPDAAMNQRFAHFLHLKKGGAHFNEKIAQSSSLKNPGLFEKLMHHANIDRQAQYSATLPEELWAPLSLPPWGHKGELFKKQQQRRQTLEAAAQSQQRSSIAFVAESGRPSEQSNASDIITLGPDGRNT
ncbi:hypothetical protein KEM54_005847 [Ascosphaera aggregata]|nr:hypothetical protein KEM54_005847 [Ascosphaera aggregata]